MTHGEVFVVQARYNDADVDRSADDLVAPALDPG